MIAAGAGTRGGAMGGIGASEQRAGRCIFMPASHWLGSAWEASCQGNLWPSRVKDKWGQSESMQPTRWVQPAADALSPSLLLDPAFSQFPCLHHPTSGSLQGLLCLAFWSTFCWDPGSAGACACWSPLTLAKPCAFLQPWTGGACGLLGSRGLTTVPGLNHLWVSLATPSRSPACR